MKVTRNRVLVEVDKPMAATAAGILIPEAWQQPQGLGTVIAAGEGQDHLKVGDRVMFRWIDGREVDLKDGRQLKLLQVATKTDVGEVLCLVEQEAA